MKKRIISAVTAAALVMAIGIPVFATAPTAPSLSDITVVNGIGKTDSVSVSGSSINVGDKFKVYKSDQTSLIGTSAASTTTGASVSLTLTSDLGLSAGSVYVSILSGTSESSKTQVSFAAEPVNTAISASDAVIANYINTVGSIKDTVTVTGSAITAGDTVTVYSASTAGTKLGTTTAAIVAGVTTAAINLTTNLPAITSGATGTVYIGVKSSSKNESTRTAVTYTKESKTTAAPTVVITNGYKAKDSAVVTGLQKYDVVKIYKNDGSATTSAALTYGTKTITDVTGSAIITLSDLGVSGGNVYVTLTRAGYTESDRAIVSFNSEPTTASPSAGSNHIVVANNVGSAGTLTLDGLNAGDIVKVYTDTTSKSAIGTKTVAASTTTASISIPDKYLTTAAGTLYVSVTSKDMNESGKVVIPYAAKVQTTAPAINTLTVNNFADVKDVITATNLRVGDTVKVYSINSTTTGALMVKGTVKSGRASLSLNLENTGSKKLNSGSSPTAVAGSVYITVTGKNELESNTVKVDYNGEPQ